MLLSSLSLLSFVVYALLCNCLFSFNLYPTHQLWLRHCMHAGFKHFQISSHSELSASQSVSLKFLSFPLIGGRCHSKDHRVNLKDPRSQHMWERWAWQGSSILTKKTYSNNKALSSTRNPPGTPPPPPPCSKHVAAVLLHVHTPWF